MKITCIHQGYELYGSDRTFIDCVDFLRDLYPSAGIEIVLPREGALSQAMRAQGRDVQICDLWVLRKSYGVAGLLARAMRLPAYIRRARRMTRDSDLVYINTGVIFDFTLAARLHRTRTVIHVHEIPQARVRPLFRSLLTFAGCGVIFNSKASRDGLALPASIPQTIVYNGTNMPPETSLPRDPRAPSDPLRVLMIGRINAWKGQDLLIEALALLPADRRGRIVVRVLGDVFETAPFLDRLRSQVAEAGLAGQVEFKGFHADPDADYAWSDLVVVPSREPEPFGLVAIEAMSHAKPVIVAGHGGLVEIVLDGEHGWHFTPNDAGSLAAMLVRAQDEADSLSPLGLAARERVRAMFTRDTFRANFQAAVKTLTASPSEQRSSVEHLSGRNDVG